MIDYFSFLENNGKLFMCHYWQNIIGFALKMTVFKILLCSVLEIGLRVIMIATVRASK